MTGDASHARIAAAAGLLRSGGVVAFPTETVYGLGAEISDPSAIRRVFEIKKRPENHPLIIHIADLSRLGHWAQEVPEQARQLAERFWPGPLTLILPRSPLVSAAITGGQDTVGLRVPDHSVALALLRALGPEKALAAPSANRFGRVSPTTADHVREELGDDVDMVLDGGPCKVGLESTIVGFDGEMAIILRPGGIPVTAVAEVLKGRVIAAERAGLTRQAVRVPGALSSHYAPLTPLELCPSRSIGSRALEIDAEGLRVAILGWSDQCPSYLRPRNHLDKRIVHISMPATPEEYGRHLYATLRRHDREGFDRLLVEAPPDESAWLAIADRLRRASTHIRRNEIGSGVKESEESEEGGAIVNEPVLNDPHE